jgi:hypothetical protein
MHELLAFSGFIKAKERPRRRWRREQKGKEERTKRRRKKTEGK